MTSEQEHRDAANDIEYLPHDLRRLAARVENEPCKLKDIHQEAVISETDTIKLSVEVEFYG